MSEAPEKIFADRGPRGGWMYRDAKMPDTQHTYIRADLYDRFQRENAELRKEAGELVVCQYALSAAEQEIETLRADCAAWAENYAELQAKLADLRVVANYNREQAEAAEQQIAELRAALAEARDWLPCVEGHLQGKNYKAMRARVDAALRRPE